MTTIIAATAAVERRVQSAGGLAPVRPHPRRAVPGLAALLPLILSTVLATGCGGGGGGNDDGPTPPPPTGTQMTGTASKGLLGSASVRVYDVTAGGVVGPNLLASTRTDSQGRFSVNVNASGPIVVTVTADGQTTMLDEISGNALAAPANLTLRTALAGPTTTPVAVTPLTEMAFRLATQRTGGLTVANIDAANSTVSAAMLNGAPVVSTKPIALTGYRTATVAEQAQAKLLTALAVAAQAGIATDRNGVQCAGADYNLRLSCLLDGLGSLLTPGASNSVTFAPQAAYLVAAYDRLNTGLATVAGGQSARAVGLDGVTAAERAMTEAISTQAVLFGFDPAASPLANTKALFADLRTNVIALQAGTDTFGVTPVLAELRADFAANVTPALTSTQAVLIGTFAAAGLLEAAVPGSLEYPSHRVVCGYDPVALQTAANVALCRYGDGYDEQVLLTVTRTAAGAYGVTSQPLTFSESGTPGAWDGILELGFVRYTRNAALAPKVASVTWNQVGTGQTASWSGPFYVTADGGYVTADLEASQSSDWDPVSRSGTLRVGGELSGGGGGIALDRAVIGEDSQITVQNGSMLSEEPATLSGALSIAPLMTQAFAYTARAEIGAPELDRSQTIGLPQTVSVTGTVMRLRGDEPAVPLFEGRIGLELIGIPTFDATQPLSATNSLVAQLQVSGSITLPDDRTLLVGIAANATQVDPTPAAPHSLSATYAYTTPAGMARINVSGEYDTTDGFSATVTTNAGVSATFTRTMSGAVSGTVMANGVETATISGTTINYSDGSTESLF